MQWWIFSIISAQLFKIVYVRHPSPPPAADIVWVQPLKPWINFCHKIHFPQLPFFCNPTSTQCRSLILICQQTNTKDIAGQSARWPQESSEENLPKWKWCDVIQLDVSWEFHPVFSIWYQHWHHSRRRTNEDRDDCKITLLFISVPLPKWSHNEK